MIGSGSQPEANPPARILVVDDQPANIQMVGSMLGSLGYEIVPAADGPSAMKTLADKPPDLILLDIGLPRLNGLEVARNLSPRARILFLSQESSPDVVEAALSLSDGYVYKPDVHRELLPAIEAVLEGKRYVSSSLEFREVAESQDSQDSQSLISHLMPSARDT